MFWEVIEGNCKLKQRKACGFRHDDEGRDVWVELSNTPRAFGNFASCRRQTIECPLSIHVFQPMLG